MKILRGSEAVLVRYLMVIVVAALMLMRTQAEETPSVFDCVYDIVGGCEYGEWGARLGSFVFDNSFGPFTNGVFYSRNDGGSHVLTGLCMNVLHKGTMESARSQIRGIQGKLSKELSSSHGGIEFSVESDAENLFVLRCLDIDGYDNSCTFVARRMGSGDSIELSCRILYVGPSTEEIRRRRQYLCDHRDEIESYIREAAIGPFNFVDATASEIIARLCKTADVKIKEKYDIDLECVASFNNKTNYSFVICTTNIFAAFEVAARSMGLGVSLDGNEISVSPHLFDVESDESKEVELTKSNVTAIEEVNYPAMIRSLHVAPPGLGRFFESFPADFLDVRFGEKLKDVGLKVCDDIQFTNKCYIVSRDLVKPYHGCRKADVYYDGVSGKLYSVRYSVPSEGFATAQEYLCVAQKIAKDIGFWYRLKFKKEIEFEGLAIEAIKEGDVVLRYTSTDEVFPNRIEIRKVKGRLQIDVSITNLIVLGRWKPKAETIDNQIDVNI